jgi:hypothetical protein
MQNYYELIFGTDYIDKLVGEGKPDCGGYSGRCVLLDKPRVEIIDNYPCRGEHDGDWCKYLLRWEDANYHRSQLANMTLEQMKERINELAGVEE